MLKHRFYYALKPYLPWHMRMGLRRVTAQRLRRKRAADWPVNPAAGRIPDNWRGWPEGKKFAFVITHDVEGPEGLEKCRQLAELEMKLGFRSSFNFIPEGSYTVPPSLRQWLVANGFEVGVHDLQHDGRLFTSQAGFERKARRINQFIREWGAKGFRAAFMLRNLDWIRQLEIEYDSSTFDTDPFELQSQGAGTIFPFVVPDGESGSAAPGKGYAELPYTMAQDSTLFLVLGETTPAIWTSKLDWIAARGGMALVNVHPDYIRFDGDAASARTYSVSNYIALLNYISERHPGAYWHALPRQVAAFVRGMQAPPTLRRAQRVCMITHSFYETDNRVTRYAEALAARGDHVDIISLRRSAQTPHEQTIEGVHVHRILDRFSKAEQTQLAYLWPVLKFLFGATRWLMRNNAVARYDLIHVHNMPDFLVFAALWPKLSGARIILDIHDIVPELYGSKFAARKRSTTVSLLKWVERRSARFADHVIVSNDLWFEKFAERTGTRGKCSVFINNVDSNVFRPGLRNRPPDRKKIILFPGGLQWHQGLDIALRAFTRVSREMPEAEFHIYGDGIMKPSLVALSQELGFNGNVRFFEPVRIKEIAQVMANADLGVVPKRADSFGNEAYSTKIMEFMSLGVPVVVSRTKIDQFYFNDRVVRFFDSGDSDALATAMLEVLRSPSIREGLIANASKYSDANSWESRRGEYLRLVDSLSPSRPVWHDAI